MVTVLVEPVEDEQGLQRLDYSASAWDAGARPPTDRVEFAFWRGVQPKSGANTPGRLISDEEMLELFGRTSTSSDDEDPRHITFRYVLALLLIRRRMLTVLSTSQDEGLIVMKVRVRGRPEEVLEVIDPALDDAALEAETQALISMLVPDGSQPDGSQPDAPTQQAPEEVGG